MFGFTRTDIIYIITHTFWFLAAYAAYMGTSHFPGWFNWQALSAGLIAAGATNTGSYLGSATSSNGTTTNTKAILGMTKKEDTNAKP